MKTRTTFTGLYLLLLALPAATRCEPLLKFGPCPSELDASDATECGTLKVPLDHTNPAGENIDIFVLRSNATSPNKLGSLFFNEGGPGIPASPDFEDISDTWSEDITANYDVIGVDPRGTGLSTRLKCNGSLFDERPSVADSFTEQGFGKLVSFNKAFGQSCLDMSGDLVNHLDTYTIMKDFELVRQALNIDKFNFVGFSYGTYFGQVYADLYPHNVGRMVLDGLTDAIDSAASDMMVEAVSLTATFDQFFQWCDSNDKCAIKDQDARSVFLEVTSGPAIPAPCSEDAPCKSPATMQDMLNAAISQLGDTKVGGIEDAWEILSVNLANANHSNASGLATPLSGDDNKDFAYLAVNCQDYGIVPSSGAHLKNIFTIAALQAPLSRGYGELFIPLVYCAGWPAPVVTRPPRSLNPDSMAALPTVLLVNAFYDPSTSDVGALSVREMMRNSINIWRNGSGHLSYPARGDTAKAIDQFLVTGSIPADGTVYEP